MKRPSHTVFLLTVPMLLGAASVLWALAGSYGKGQVGGSSEWPAGLRELANSEACLGGYFVNANDWVYFSGDTPTLNRFLERYAQLEETPLRVVIKLGEKPSTGAFGPSGHYDWSLTILRRGWGAPEVPAGTSGKYVVTASIWLDEHIQVDDLYLFGKIAPLVLPPASRR